MTAAALSIRLSYEHACSSNLWPWCCALHSALEVVIGDLAALLMADGHHRAAAALASALYEQASGVGREQVSRCFGLKGGLYGCRCKAMEAEQLAKAIQSAISCLKKHHTGGQATSRPCSIKLQPFLPFLPILPIQEVAAALAAGTAQAVEAGSVAGMCAVLCPACTAGRVS